MGIKYVVLHWGYAESGSSACTIFQNCTGLDMTPKQAVRSLASGVFRKYLFDHGSLETDPDQKLDRCLVLKKQFINCFPGLCDADPGESGGEEIPGWSPWTNVLEVMNTATVPEVLLIGESGAEVVTEFLAPEDVPEKYRSIVESWSKLHIAPNVKSEVERVGS